MNRTRFFFIALAATLGITALAHAQTIEENRRTITVSGEGVVRVEPDKAIVRFGIVTRDDDPEEARRRNAAAAREAMNAVRELGVEERRIRLETLRLQPFRHYEEPQRRWVEAGFEAIREVVVELHDIEQLPVLIARIVQRGANRLNSVAYDIQDRNVPRDQALREAVLGAREKARLIAETLDASLGQVLRINEQSFDFPRPMIRMEEMQMAASRDAAAPEPEAYAAGEIEVRAHVQTVFELR